MVLLLDRKADRGLQVAKGGERRALRQRKRCAVHEVETERRQMITWLLGSERGCEQSLVYLDCQCCRLVVARDAWRVCRMANGIRFAMICIIILRLF